MKYDKRRDCFVEEDKIVVAGAVIINKDKILLIKTKAKGNWELPSGVVNLKDRTTRIKNDTLEHAAIRCVKESTNVKIKIEKDFKPFYIDYITKDRRRRRNYNFLAICNKPPIDICKDVFSDCRYIHISELPLYRLSPNVEILTKLFKVGLLDEIQKFVK